VNASWSALLPNLALTFPFELDTFQKEAVLHLEQGHSVREIGGGGEGGGGGRKGGGRDRGVRGREGKGEGGVVSVLLIHGTAEKRGGRGRGRGGCCVSIVEGC